MNLIVDIKDTAGRAASKSLSPVAVEDVQVEAVVGADGDELLRITLVLPDGSIDTLDGDRVLATLVAIHNALDEAGETRRPTVEYVTFAELRNDGDTES